jgi:RimJ/RimL family protein N-acetyltransferase
MGATDFAVVREVGTGSWLGRQYQGQGIGTRMRAAVLALAFDGLGAQFATSGAFALNLASLRVSRKLGYADDGIERLMVRGEPHETRRLRLDKTSWQAHRSVQVAITGLEPCLPFFGAV